MGSIYRPPSSKKVDDLSIEANIERVHLLNKETLIVSDINIDFRDKLGYNKHRLAKGLRCMHFEQLVDFITRPVSKACLDHVYCNRPQRIELVPSHDIGLADHLPVFVVRKCARENINDIRINYRDRKRLDEKQLEQALQQAPWDAAFVFEDISCGHTTDFLPR